MDPVTQSLFQLTGDIERYGSNRRANELALQDLGLQSAQMDINRQSISGQQTLDLAKAKREKYLSEQVTVGQAIDTHPTWTPEQKESIKQSIPKDMRNEYLNHLTTRRKINDAIDQLENRRYEAEQKRLDRASRERQGMLNRKSAEKIADVKQVAKPSETLSQLKLEAWKNYMQGKATPEQESMIGVDKDPFLSQAANIVSQDYTMFGKSADEIVTKIGDVAEGLRKNRQQNPKKQTNKGIPEPPEGFVLDENSD